MSVALYLQPRWAGWAAECPDDGAGSAVYTCNNQIDVVGLSSISGNKPLYCSSISQSIKTAAKLINYKLGDAKRQNLCLF